MKKIFSLFLLIILTSSSSIFSQKFGSEEILPIELIYFEGFAMSNGILLRWGTATEVNNFGFEVQRADTSKIFEYVDFVPGSGNSNSPKHYFLIDSTLPGPGLYFYRLKQIDTDGSYHYSDTIQISYNPLSVENERSNSNLSVVFINNYLEKQIELNFKDLFIKSNIVVEIYSILGERIFQHTYDFLSDRLKISYSGFPSGVYFISIKTLKKILLIQKFIVTR